MNRLLAECVQIVVDRRLPGVRKDLDRTKRYIRAFNDADPLSDVFRYPVTRGGRQSLPGSIKQADIPNFCGSMGEAKAELENLSGLLDADREMEQEFSLENML